MAPSFQRDVDSRPAAAPAGAPGAAAAAEVRRGARRGGEREELKLCGLAAVRARFARDPGSIQRLFFDRATGQRVGAMCQALAQAKKVYRQVEAAELEKVAGSLHHGGIVAVVTPPELRRATANDIRQWAARGETLVVLDRIGNAHNLGAIARTAAFFGVPRIVIPETATAARPNEAAHRVAEGGLEQIEVWLAADLASTVRALAAAGYEVVGAATRGASALRGVEKGAGGRAPAQPVAVVLGNEEQGLAPGVAAACTRLVTIPGRGQVESLNVSVAAAILLWELCVRRP